MSREINPSKKSWLRADRHYLWHPFSRFSEIQNQDFPIITKGSGPYLYDLAGRRLFDAVSSWWSNNLGHSQPKIIEAIKKQAAELQHSILGNLSHPQAIKLAEELNAVLPGTHRRAFFASDGASAVEAALKIAAQYWYNLGDTKRNKFVSLEHAYHGDTLGAVAVGFQPVSHKPFDCLLNKPLQAPSPCCADCVWGQEPATCRQECFEPMRKLIEAHSQRIIAVIVEPLCQGAAGMRIYHANYLRLLADCCREHKIPLIADEIAVGMGRTGCMWAFEHAAIQPDIICIGKGLSAGYLPLSVTMVKEEIYQTFTDQREDNTFYHGHTFAGNPIACSAAIAALDFYREHQVVSQAKISGAYLASEFQSLRELPQVSRIRSLGMLAACELQAGKHPAAYYAGLVQKILLQEGVLIRPLGNVIYLMPPLLTSASLLAETVKQLKNAIRTAYHLN